MEQKTSKLGILSVVISPILVIIMIIFYIFLMNQIDNYLCRVINYCILDDWFSLLIPLVLILGIILPIISLIIIKKRNLKGRVLAIVSLVSSIVILIFGGLILWILIIARGFSGIVS